jgi:hypothetical protein
VLPVLPVVGNFGIPEDELYDVGEARLCSHIVGKNYCAPLTLLNAHNGVRSLLVVSTFEEAMPLRPIEHDNSEPCIEVFMSLPSERVHLSELV